MSRGSKRIVIDTSIARSAGKTEHPLSRSCREFLEQVLNICHHVVMTPDIRKEWKKHRSRFTATWLASMTARKKVCVVSPTADVSIVEKLKKAQVAQKDETAILKDVLLIEAALATDSAVASLDEEVRTLLKALSNQWGAIRGVAWVNPTKAGDRSLAWLSSGALPDKERLLGYEAE